MSKLNRDYKTCMRAVLALYGQTLAAVMRAAPLASNETHWISSSFSLRGNWEKEGGCQRLQADCISGAGAKKPRRASVWRPIVFSQIMTEVSEILMSVLSTIRVPRPGDRVHKDECAFSFASPVSSAAACDCTVIAHSRDMFLCFLFAYGCCFTFVLPGAVMFAN